MEEGNTMRKQMQEAINAIITDLVDKKVTDSKISTDMVTLACVMSDADSDLHDCVNELCLKCGSYRYAADACDGCRWKTVKEGFR